MYICGINLSKSYFNFRNMEDKEPGGMQNENISQRLISTLKEFWHYAIGLMHLETDTEADATETIQQIEKSVVFKGTNLWILIFSVLVCSVGLNINSTPVVIGAMLISPLLGPIMGIGLGVGINDLRLIKKSMINFGEMVSFAVVASAIYFYITPLSEAQSELLARTTPTIFDAFIALFGGFAGIVAYSRKDKGGTAIPGVAIATALMPPLCTAGFGLATMDPKFLFGALYLFLLNSIFISLATLITVRYLKYPKKAFVDAAREKRVKWYITFFVIITIIPSIFMAYRVTMRSFFTTSAMNFVTENFDFEQTRVINRQIIYNPRDTSIIDLTLFGEPLNPELIEVLEGRMDRYGLRNTRLIINQSDGKGIGMDDLRAEILSASLRSDIMDELFRRNENLIQEKDDQIQELQTLLQDFNRLDELSREVFRELVIQYPEVSGFSLGRMTIHEDEELPPERITTALVNTSDGPMQRKDTFERWLRVRLNEDNIRFVYIE